MEVCLFFFFFFKDHLLPAPTQMIQLEPTHSILSRLQTVPGTRVSQTQLKHVLLTHAIAQGAQHRGPPAHRAGVPCDLSAQERDLTLSPHGALRPAFQMCPFPFHGTAASHKFKRSCDSSLPWQLVPKRITVKPVAHNSATSCPGGSQKNPWVYFRCKKGHCLQERTTRGGVLGSCVSGPPRRYL